MRTLQYDNEVEFVQFKVGENWFIFTTDFVIQAPIDQLYNIVEDIYNNDPQVTFLTDVDHVNAIEAYKEEHYPELVIPNYPMP